MSVDKDKDKVDRAPARSEKHNEKAAQSDIPGWANGLRQLYDSVVEEEIPDSFRDLLSKLDDGD